MANITFPCTAPFNWLLQAASKLQKSCYRKAGFTNRTKIKEQSILIDKLKENGEKMMAEYELEIRELKSELKKKNEMVARLTSPCEKKCPPVKPSPQGGIFKVKPKKWKITVSLPTINTTIYDKREIELDEMTVIIEDLLDACYYCYDPPPSVIKETFSIPAPQVTPLANKSKKKRVRSPQSSHSSASDTSPPLNPHDALLNKSPLSLGPSPGKRRKKKKKDKDTCEPKRKRLAQTKKKQTSEGGFVNGQVVDLDYDVTQKHSAFDVYKKGYCVDFWLYRGKDAHNGTASHGIVLPLYKIQIVQQGYFLRNYI